MTKNHNTLVKIGLFSFIVGITIGFASVNELSLIAVPLIRNSTLTVAAIVLLIILKKSNVRSSAIASVAMLFFLIFYGLIRGTGQIGYYHFIPNLLISTAVVSAGLMYFSFGRDTGVQFAVAENFRILSIAILAFLLLSGGLLLYPVPMFNFEYKSSSGDSIFYSQGVTKFFGISAIASIYAMKSTPGTAANILLLTLVLIFVVVSFLGGGRGDFIALVVVLFLMGVSINLISALLTAVFVILLYFMFALAAEKFSEDFVPIMRFLVFIQDGNLGMRDVLLFESFALLSDRVDCLLAGCGYTFFQKYFGYDYGLYPHNVLIEFVIVWGLPIFLFVITFFIIGVARAVNRGFLGWLGLFFMIIELKSGNVIDSWFVMTFILHYFGIGFSGLFRSRIGLEHG